MPLKTFLLLAFGSVAFSQTPILHPPVFSANQDFFFTESVRTKTTTKASGTGVTFSFPPPSVSDLTGDLSHRVHVIIVNAVGFPTQFAVTYTAKAPDGVTTSKSGPLGRLFVVDSAKQEPQVSVRDGKPITPSDRTFVTDNARRLLSYLAAIKDVSALKVMSGDRVDLPANLVNKLLDIHDQIRGATMKLSGKEPTLSFDVQVVSIKPGDDDVVMTGLLNVAPDWSSMTGSFSTKSSKEVSLDSAKIRIDAETSLELSRTIGQP